MQSFGDIARAVADDMQASDTIAHCPKHGAYERKAYALYAGGRQHWTKCASCESDARAAADAAAAAKRAQDEAKRHEEMLNRAGIPARFRSRTLDAFIADTPAKQRAYGIARAFADDFRDRYTEGANLIFAGAPGTGKSHLALGIAQAIMPQWNSIYVTARELIGRLRDTWRRDSDVSERDLQATFTRTSLLIIDEVGVQFGSEAERVQLFGVIDDRYREQKPTILLTNLGAQDFEGFIGARAFDRLKECGEWVQFDWESYRGRK